MTRTASRGMEGARHDISESRSAGITERGSHAEPRGRLISRPRSEEALKFSVAHNTEREAVIDRRALERTALQYAMGIANLESVRPESGLRESRGDLIALAVSLFASDSSLHHRPRWWRWSARISNSCAPAKDAPSPSATERYVRSWAAGRALSGEQARGSQS